MAEQGNKIYQFRHPDGSISNSPDWVNPATGEKLGGQGQLIQGAANPGLVNGFVGGGVGGNIFNADGSPAMVAGSSGGPISAAPGGNGGGYGTSNLGNYGAAPYGGGGYSPGGNPYLQGMGEAAIAQNTQNFNRNVLPNISSRSMATGGYGGSRQGVIEATAANDLNTGNANALANLYGNQYNNDQNRNLGYYQAGNSYNLGLDNLGLGYAGLDRQISNDNLSWQQQGYNNNLSLWDRLQGNNQAGINAGQTIQDTPLNYWNNISQGANSIGRGYSTNTTQTSNQSNPILAGLGGAQLGSQLGSWWNGGGSTGARTNDPFGMISF